MSVILSVYNRTRAECRQLQADLVRRVWSPPSQTLLDNGREGSDWRVSNRTSVIHTAKILWKKSCQGLAPDLTCFWFATCCLLFHGAR